MAGVPVACHAHGGPGLLRAVRADVDTIEHGVWLDQSCVGEMARRGTRYVRTLAVYHWPHFGTSPARSLTWAVQASATAT